MFKKLCFSLIVYFVVAPFVFGQNNKINAVYIKNRSAVFKVEVLDEQNQIIKTGTGFFISEGGLAITNYHVIQGAKSARIVCYNGKIFNFKKIISWDRKRDLVKFQIAFTNSKFNFIKRSTIPSKVGDDVLVIGNPKDFNFSVSNGIISSFRIDSKLRQVIQTTVPISSGSSGSPLLTMEGKYIGVISYSYSNAQNLNFAISASEINNLQPIDKLIYPELDSLPVSSSSKFEDTKNEAQIVHLSNCRFGQNDLSIKKKLSFDRIITKSTNFSTSETKVPGTISASNKNNWLVTSVLVEEHSNLILILTIGIDTKNYLNNKIYVLYTEIRNGNPSHIIDGFYETSLMLPSNNRKREKLKFNTNDFSEVGVIIIDGSFIDAFAKSIIDVGINVYTLNKYSY